MSISFSPYVFSSDGSTLSGWTNSGITVSSGVGNPAPSFAGIGGALYAYINPASLSSFVGYTILVDMYATGATPLVDLYFGCNSSGAGQMFRIDARGDGTHYTGFATTTGWVTWTAPSTGIYLSVNTWYTIKIVITSTAMNGMSWYYNNVLGGTGTFVDNGGYIAMQGDGGTGGYWDNIAIYPTAASVPASISFYSPVVSNGLIWTSYNGYFNDDVKFFLSAITLTGAIGAYTGTSSDLTSLTTATNSNWDGSDGTPDNFSVQWLGYFLAPQTGTYTWATSSDDASFLWIGSTAIAGYTTTNAVVKNGGAHAMTLRTGTASLNAGVYYPIRIQYGEAAGDNNIQTYFTLPSDPTTPIYDGTGYYFNDGTLFNGSLSNPSSMVPASIGFGYTLPINIKGIRLWLDAKDTTTLILNGTSVNQWNDKSGLGNNATPYGTSATNPTYSSTGFNNLPAIQFTSTYPNDIQGFVTNSPAGTYSGGMYGFVVFQKTGVAQAPPYGETLFAKTGTGTSNSRPAPFDMYGTYRLYGDGNITHILSTVTGLNISTATGLNIFYTSMTPGTTNLVVQEYLNGTLGMNISSLTPVSYFVDTGTNLYIGERGDKTDVFNGVMSEVIILNVAPTTRERQQVEGYLAWKWNLVSQLPAGHPYKTAPPL